MPSDNLVVLNSGSTLLATSTPTASTVPLTDANGTINSFVTALSVSSANGVIPLGDGGGTLTAWGACQNNLTATFDPDINSDTSKGYAVGSLWINTSGSTAWVCMGATKGAAQWQLTSQESGTAASGQLQTFNGQLTHFLGRYTDYSGSVALVASRLYYIRNWLNVGTVITKMECGSVTGATANINMGIYNEASGNVPNSRLAQTGTTAIGAGNSNTFVAVALSAPWTVPSSGYYWFAIICDSATPTFSATANVRGQPMINRAVLFQAGSTTVLPATASTANTNSAVPYLSAVE